MVASEGLVSGFSPGTSFASFKHVIILLVTVAWRREHTNMELLKG